jgi:hypothetical protein
MLKCFSKVDGGVIPGLLGPWSLQDPVGWSDDVTLDYNVEANFYGAASSNHPEAMMSYFATLEGLVPLGRLRASLPSWHLGGHETHQTHGQQTEAMGCACNNYDHCITDIHGKTCPVGFGGFDGIEIPSAIGGFPELHCSHDSAMRNTAAMAAQPFVDYYEHTLDNDFLKDHAYPFVREVVRFYASYMKLDPATKRYGIPHACSQELCGQRQGGGGHPPQRSPTIDISYVQWLFSRAVEWSTTLGIDADQRQLWGQIVGALPPYPLAQHPACNTTFPWAEGDCTGWSEATNVDTNSSATIFSNYNWPIANFAPIHPTGQVSLSSDNATKKIARRTVWMINSHSDWHPVNGICLAWPSAARMADKHDNWPFSTDQLLLKFENALNKTMQPNFWPSMGGGGLEQVGATQALNELLLQSFEGFLRFFPGWPLGEPASFVDLRTRGAFLVSAKVNAAGTTSGIVVKSLAGATCTVLNPFAPNALAVRDQAAGAAVPVRAVGGGRFAFNTTQGGVYAVSTSPGAPVAAAGA